MPLVTLIVVNVTVDNLAINQQAEHVTAVNFCTSKHYGLVSLEVCYYCVCLKM